VVTEDGAPWESWRDPGSSANRVYVVRGEREHFDTAVPEFIMSSVRTRGESFVRLIEGM
jgi:hypothetical protein